MSSTPGSKGIMSRSFLEVLQIVREIIPFIKAFQASEDQAGKFAAINSILGVLVSHKVELAEVSALISEVLAILPLLGVKI